MLLLDILVEVASVLGCSRLVVKLCEVQDLEGVTLGRCLVEQPRVVTGTRRRLARRPRC